MGRRRLAVKRVECHRPATCRLPNEGCFGVVDVRFTAPYNAGMKTLTIECPDSLVDRLERLVQAGWVVDQQQAMIEALRRFLDSHRPEIIESQVLADVEWGLHGND